MQKNNNTARRPGNNVINGAVDRLPPHDSLAEKAVIGCIIINPADAMKECKHLMPDIFYDVACRRAFHQMATMYKRREAIDYVTVAQKFTTEKTLDDYSVHLFMEECQEAVPSASNLPYWLEILRDKYALRQTMAACQETISRIHDYEGNVEELMIGVRADLETVSRLGTKKREAMLDIISPKEAREFEPDPDDYMLGNGLIMRGQVVTIGGQPGVGKSRLATSLAVAGASGVNHWQKFPIRSKWRTLILQTENQGNRLKEEFEAMPKKYDEFIRVSRSLPMGMAFGSPEFRAELQAFYDSWPFEMLILDPLNDIVAEDGQQDYKDAIQNIRRAFIGRKMPCIVIVAHLRKPRAEHGNRRKGGRELLHELSGTLAIGSTSRTVFIVQAASNSLEDDRVVFEVAKANDCKPEWIKEYGGGRSAWHRRNGLFEPVEDFDWHGWDNPGNEERRAVTPEMLREVFKGQKELRKAQIAKLIAEKFDVGESTVFRAIEEGGYLSQLISRTPNSAFKLKA